MKPLSLVSLFSFTVSFQSSFSFQFSFSLHTQVTQTKWRLETTCPGNRWRLSYQLGADQVEDGQVDVAVVILTTEKPQ